MTQQILVRRRPTSGHKAHSLVIAYIVAMILCWLPIPLIGYAVPPLCLLVYSLFSGDGAPIKRFLILTGLAFALVLIWDALEPFFLFQNGAIAYITYNMWICLACFITVKDLSSREIDRVEKPILWMVLLQACVGIAQAAYGFTQTGTLDFGNGDYVRGTLSLSLDPIASFANPTYAANLSVLLLAVLRRAWVLRGSANKWRIVVLLMGTLSLILSSVVHILGMLVAGLLVAWLLMLPKKKLLTSVVALASIAILAALVYNILNRNVAGLPRFAASFLDETPRGRLIQRLFVAMPEEYPLMPVIGLGPGQFCSRAGLIAGGVFFGGPRDRTRSIPLIDPELTDPLNRYHLDLWYSSFGSQYDGSNYRPFSSWISVYSEFGLVGFLLACLFVVRLLLRARRWRATREGAAMAFVFTTGVLLMFFLGFQENYWEVPQALFPGVLYLYILYRHGNLVTRRPPRLQSRAAMRLPGSQHFPLQPVRI
jgi:hypothetical protein